MKKIFVVLAILFVGILLAGCTSQPAAPVATPAPTPVPTPVVTVPPTPEPTKEIIIVVKENETATPTPTPTPAPVYTITFTRSMQILNGPTANIKVGTIVRWINEDNLKPHGVEATDPSDGTWISGGTNSMIPFGAPLDITFDKVGNYDYRTTFQPQVYGKIAVTA